MGVQTSHKTCATCHRPRKVLRSQVASWTVQYLMATARAGLRIADRTSSSSHPNIITLHNDGDSIRAEENSLCAVHADAQLCISDAHCCVLHRPIREWMNIRYDPHHSSTSAQATRIRGHV